MKLPHIQRLAISCGADLIEQPDETWSWRDGDRSSEGFSSATAAAFDFLDKQDRSFQLMRREARARDLAQSF